MHKIIYWCAGWHRQYLATCRGSAGCAHGHQNAVKKPSNINTLKVCLQTKYLESILAHVGYHGCITKVSWHAKTRASLLMAKTWKPLHALLAPLEITLSLSLTQAPHERVAIQSTTCMRHLKVGCAVLQQHNSLPDQAT